MVLHRGAVGISAFSALGRFRHGALADHSWEDLSRCGIDVQRRSTGRRTGGRDRRRTAEKRAVPPRLVSVFIVTSGIMPQNPLVPETRVARRRSRTNLRCAVDGTSASQRR